MKFVFFCESNILIVTIPEFFMSAESDVLQKCWQWCNFTRFDLVLIQQQYHFRLEKDKLEYFSRILIVKTYILHWQIPNICNTNTNMFLSRPCFVDISILCRVFVYAKWQQFVFFISLLECQKVFHKTGKSFVTFSRQTAQMWFCQNVCKCLPK